MNRKERRNLQRQGVQVPKDPTLNIKLSALGKSIMTPEMRATSSKPLSAMINLRTLMRVLTLASSASCPSADTFLMALYAVGSA